MSKEREIAPVSFVFFGTPKFAVGVLDELEKAGILPSIVVAAPDKPRGRRLIITPPETKIWAKKRNIPVLQPEKLRDENFVKALQDSKSDIFIVAAYGKLIPESILKIPPYGTINVHPSLLPKLRGASPIQSAILSEDKTGTTIIKVDEEMDHGDILAQETLTRIIWPPKESVLEEALEKQGGQMLAHILPRYLKGEITPYRQDHRHATFTQKIRKEDGLINPENISDAGKNFRKFQAFEQWPRTYFFRKVHGKDLRIIVTDAVLENGRFLIKKVLPEGGKEIEWEIFLKTKNLV